MSRDLDLGSGHLAHRRASLIDLYLQQFHSNRRNFLWMDGWTYVFTEDGQTLRQVLEEST